MSALTLIQLASETSGLKRSVYKTSSALPEHGCKGCSSVTEVSHLQVTFKAIPT